jgi:hypothetical protein
VENKRNVDGCGFLPCPFLLRYIVRMWNVVVYVGGGVATHPAFASPLHLFFIDKVYTFFFAGFSFLLRKFFY